MATFPALPVASDPPAKLRLSSPADVLAAVPYLIGFVPTRSVVVMCLRGKQLGLTMRLDLDLAAEELHQVILERVRGERADRALVVLFDPDAGVGGRRPGDAVARRLIRALRRSGIKVQDALGVRSGRFWSYLCKEETCCPTAGRPLPVAGAAEHTNVAASFVAMGSAPLGSREQLSATLGPVTGADQTDMETALQNALTCPAASPLDRWWTVVSRYAEGPPRPGGTLTAAEAARLIVSLRDVKLRDEIISWSASNAAVGLLTVLRELAPLALAPFAAQVLATLAWSAYSFGDGALAAMALERALAADPEHSLARLLATALEGGIGPAQLQGISAELSRSGQGDAALPRWLPGAP